MQKFSHRIPLLFLSIGAALCWLSQCILAQQQLGMQRLDGHTTTLLLYPAIGAGSACAPLAVISHGAGDRNGTDYSHPFY